MVSKKYSKSYNITSFMYNNNNNIIYGTPMISAHAHPLACVLVLLFSFLPKNDYMQSKLRLKMLRRICALFIAKSYICVFMQ